MKNICNDYQLRDGERQAGEEPAQAGAEPEDGGDERSEEGPRVQLEGHHLGAAWGSRAWQDRS